MVDRENRKKNKERKERKEDRTKSLEKRARRKIEQGGKRK